MNHRPAENIVRHLPPHPTASSPIAVKETDCSCGSAILTKYTSLRSFYEQTVKGSPLDYEIAGIYTSALLDAYMVSGRITTVWVDM